MKKNLAVLLLLGSSCFGTELIEKESIGIEINPFRLLISDGSWQSFSGTISHFNDNTGIEIAMPIYYKKKIHNYDTYENHDTTLNLDIHYRKYFSGTQTEGVYLGGFGRYTYIDAKARNDDQYRTVQKFGIGAEIGLKGKKIFNTSFYWGASLALGGYLSNDNDMFDRTDIFDNLGNDDRKMILDLELLKIGYNF